MNNENYLKSLQCEDWKHVAIICHDQPDPDCLASAMAMREIASSIGLESTIYYGGEISHTQNRVMINVLNIPIVKLDKDDETAESIRNSIDKSYIVLVDTANFKKENCVAISSFISKDRTPNVIIDHHTLNAAAVCNTYVHKQYGACTTIMYQLLKERDIVISKNLATAMYMGISTDTDDLKAEGTSDEDRQAFEELKKIIDPEIFLKIFNYPKPFALLSLRTKAYNSIQVKDNLAIASVGVINPQQRALLAELCQEILEIEAIETVVVLGLIDEGFGKEKLIGASFRSRVLAIDTKDFIQRVFGKKHGGGRKGCGAARVPLDVPTSDTIDRLLAEESKEETLEYFVSTLFGTYECKIREEKEKI